MNKVFIFIIILVCSLNIFYFNLKDVLFFPPSEPAIYGFLSNFTKEFPQLKEIGYYSNIKENRGYVLFRIQNSIAPVLINDSVNYDYLFCYSPDFTCRKIILNGSAALVKAYSDQLFLLKRMEENQK